LSHSGVFGFFSRLGAKIALIPILALTLIAGSQTSTSATEEEGIGLTVRVVTPINRATTPPPIVDAPIVIPPNALTSQETILIDLSGFQPFSYVEIYVRSEPVLLASGFADSTGQFTARVDIPNNLPPGDHSITVANTLPDGSFQEIILTQFGVTESGTVGPAQDPIVDGALSLEVPANAAAVFNTPSLVNNRSVTIGTVGGFAVVDDRELSKPGWTVAVNVAPFVLTGDQTKVFESSYLGLTPVLVASSTSVGVELGTGITAGTIGSYPAVFAEADPGVGTGRTSLNGNLALIPPVQHTVGTYTSTMTLTLTSK
jgi:hypothetical protein